MNLFQIRYEALESLDQAHFWEPVRLAEALDIDVFFRR